MLSAAEQGFLKIGVSGGSDLRFRHLNPSVYLDTRSNSGLTSFPEAMAGKPISPPAVVTAFSLLNIDFAGLSYLDRLRNLHRYKLEGQGSNNRGVWNESGIALQLKILPVWWGTWWFLALIGAAVLLWAAFRYRMQHVERESGRLRNVIETIPGYVWTAEPDGSVDFVNQRLLRFTGLPPNQVLGWGWVELVHPEDRQVFVDTWRTIIESGRGVDVEARIRGADGQYRWHLFRSQPLRNPAGRVIKWYGESTDIDDRKRAEEERERLQHLEAEIAHINRVSMMGELAASIAHEVNQPLTGIVSNGGACLRWLAADQPDLEEVRAAVHDIVRDGKRAGEVIARIRALTKRSAPPHERLDLNDTIREVLALASDEAKENRVTVRTAFAESVCPVLGDKVQLQQVLLNLIINAIQAMNGVRGRTRTLSISTRVVEPNGVEVTVEDSGTGLEPDAMARIFEPFFTTKPGGMGMGLSISRSIIEKHGGRLWATVSKGPGATFHFTLPQYQEKEQNAGAALV